MNSHCDIPYELLMKIQTGTMAYSYKGIETLKNPFDMALYAKLLWETRPKTIIELGSWQGGGALWLADQMSIYGVDTQVISMDIEDKIDIKDDRISFLVGDVYDLGRTFTADFMKKLERPFLVIEDADHSKASTLAAMNFFAPVLEQDEYMIIEDGILHAMGVADDYGGGPTAAIDEFFRTNPNDFEIDRTYCDFYGQNVTWNTNGFLRKL